MTFDLARVTSYDLKTTMITSFQLATENPTLSKDQQFQTWLEFGALLSALSSAGLEYSPQGLETLTVQASPRQQKTLNKALKARDRLVYTNQALVIKLAQQYANEAISQNDLIQTGNYGLMKALIKFKPKKNAKFSSYAYFWIKAVIFEALYRVDPIYIPQKVKREMTTFHFVSVQEEDRVKEMSNSDRVTASTVNEVLSNLTDKEQEVLSDSFGLDGNTTLLTYALMNGLTYDEAFRQLEEVLEKARDTEV